ncbi:MAG: hypothetical protein L0K86_26145, partial [Actinomycetia bacterium]|nr:hypothetical protein [Actinomycetes bacterium]
EPEVARLECPECGEDAVEAPPDTTVPYGAHTQQVLRYAHPDGEPLCPVVGPCGNAPAQPREVLDEETARRAQLARWHADDHPDGDAAGDAAGVDR